MTNVRMKAIDTLHISSVKADNLMAGEEFVVPGYLADEIEGKGLAATRLGDEPEAPEEKAAPAPENKMERAPANKAARAPAKKALG